MAEVAHDARNMVTALGLYCDLLEEPGVLANPFAHYGSELRLVAAASRRLVEKLVAIDTDHETPFPIRSQRRIRSADGVDRRQPACMRNDWMMGWDPKPSAPIGSLAVELLANHNLLAALAGSSITLTVDVDGGARPVWMTGEDMTRVLVNLVKNAGEAMPSGGRIQIGLRELPASAGAMDSLVLTVEDNGPGIPEQAQTTIFESGYTRAVKMQRPREAGRAHIADWGLRFPAQLWKQRAAAFLPATARKAVRVLRSNYR